MFFTKAIRGKSFIRHRLAAIKGLLGGVFSLAETIAIILPAKISPTRASLMPRYMDFLKEKTEEEIRSFMEKNYPSVLNKIEGDNRSALLYDDKLSLVYEVIVADQYKAKKFLKPDSIVIDAGANIGVFSVFAATIAKQGKIFAFEPVKKTYDIMQRNVRGLSQVLSFQKGLGEKEGVHEILTSYRSAGMSAMVDSELAEKNKKYFDGAEKVEITTIDKVVEREKIPRVDFIKIDTEGYEANVLEGARETIKKWKPVIAMSAYHNKNDKENLPKLLKNICGDYVCELHISAEEDLICYVK